MKIVGVLFIFFGLISTFLPKQMSEIDKKGKEVTESSIKFTRTLGIVELIVGVMVLILY